MKSRARPAGSRSASGGPTLGRGLSSLIPDHVLHTSAPGARTLLHVPIETIRRNPRQPRSRADPSALDSLARSIREHGVLSPLLVREDAGSYVLIAGERRWLAAGRAGLQEVPVLVARGSGKPGAHLILALVENLQREDLDPVDEAIGFKCLVEEFNLRQADIGRLVGRDRSTIANALRLLRLPRPALEALSAGQISTGHAKALLSLDSPGAIPGVLRSIVHNDLSVRATERMVASINKKANHPHDPKALEPPPPIRHAQDLLTRSLGARVQIRPRSRGGGRIVIDYGGDEELTALVERMLQGA